MNGVVRGASYSSYASFAGYTRGSYRWSRTTATGGASIGFHCVWCIEGEYLRASI